MDCTVAPCRPLIQRTGQRVALGTSVANLWGASYVWNLQPFSLQRHFANTGGMITSVAFLSDSTRLVSASRFDVNRSGDVEFWKVDDPNKWYEAKANFYGATIVALSPDEQKIAVASDSTASILSATDGKTLATLNLKFAALDAMMWTRDSTALVTADHAGAVKRWKPDGTLMDTVSLERELRPVPEGQGMRPEEVILKAISPDTKQVAGVRYSAERQRQIRIWDTTTGKSLQTFNLKLGQIGIMRFSPDSQLLAIGDDEGNVALLDFKTKTERVIEAHLERITAVTWSPRGSRLVTTSGDGTAKFWDTASTRLLATLWVLKGSQEDGRVALDDVRQVEAPQWIAFTPEGFYTSSPQAEAYIRWRVGNTLFPSAKYAAIYNRPDLVERALRPAK
jgi:WD40 repeat protein